MSGVKGITQEGRFRESYAERKAAKSAPPPVASDEPPPRRFPPNTRFYLRTDKGDYLRFDTKGVTKAKKKAFWGIAAQIEQMRRNNPNLEPFKAVPYDE